MKQSKLEKLKQRQTNIIQEMTKARSQGNLTKGLMEELQKTMKQIERTNKGGSKR